MKATNIFLKGAKLSAFDRRRIGKIPKITDDELAQLAKKGKINFVSPDFSDVTNKSLQYSHNKNIALLKSKITNNDQLAKSFDKQIPIKPTVGKAFRGREAITRDLLLSQAMQKNPQLAAANYSFIYNTISKSKINRATQARLNKLNRPINILQLSDAIRIGVELGRLVSIWNNSGIHVVIPWVDLNQNCPNEIGIGINSNVAGNSTGDMTEFNAAARKDPTDLNPNGLIKNINFPLRPHVTCVRNQANRGTCDAFGMIAAVEAKISVKHGQKMNLSEQDLYMYIKNYWFPIPPNYGDGVIAIIDVIGQMLSGYVFAYENAWDYNPSYSRQDLLLSYSHSADGYQGIACSDTNHQAEIHERVVGVKKFRDIVDTINDWVVDPVTNAIDGAIGVVTGQPSGHWVTNTVHSTEEYIEDTIVYYYETNVVHSSGISVTNVNFISCPALDPNWQVSLGVAKFHLDHLNPLVLSIVCNEDFMDDNHLCGNGYVNYTPGFIGNYLDTGHTIMICGYVENVNLPAGAPQGSGGGYFIVKNSWGTLKGDNGFYYVPYDYVKDYSSSIIAILDVS
ncbi:MAG: C1 family peptidase [Prolixibacteraceae bacterium]